MMNSEAKYIATSLVFRENNLTNANAEDAGGKKIRFDRLEITPREVSVDAEIDDERWPLYFKFDREVPVSSSNVALALSTLCGTAFADVEFDFEVSRGAIEEIAKFTEARTTSSSATEASRPASLRSGNLLSFSGGFDSMAALALMPSDTHLVSLDFGGWFKREANFFRKFNTLVIETNVRRTPSQADALARNHWAFMAIGALLTADYFNTKYHTFGSILGDTFRYSTPPAQNRLSLLDFAGYEDAAYVSGITEIGTAAITAKHFGHMVSDSLASLAGKADRKRYLKIAISHLVAEQLSLNLDLPELDDNWQTPIKFTNSYTTALGAYYFISQGRTDMISPLFDTIPDSILELGKTTDGKFHLKYNVDSYNNFPEELWPQLNGRLGELGFTPYNSDDWGIAENVRATLNEIFESKK